MENENRVTNGSTSGSTPAAEPAAEPSTLDSVDDIAAALSGDNQPAGGDNSQQQEPAAQTEPTEGQPADNQQTDGQTQEPGEVPMPEGFEAGVWGGLAPEARTAVHAMAEAHAQALSRERQAVIAERAERDNQINAAAAILGQANQLLGALAQAEYAGIDWQRLSQENPAEYVKLAGAYQKRMQAVQALGAQVRQTAQAVQARRDQEARQGLQNEYAALEPKIRALVGDGYKGPEFAADLVKYMQSNGVPIKIINNLTKGYEVEMAAKAMLYDRMAQARATAAQKVADAPKVQAPSGSGSDGSDSVRKQAFSRFRKNPNSTDALAAALAAM